MANLDYSKLPEGLRGGMQRYIEHGISPGGFLTAVLANDLKEACARADIENRFRLFEIVSWLYNDAPQGCWGSPEHVSRWKSKIADSQASER